MRYLRSWPGCSVLALSTAFVPPTALGEPLDLPVEVADSIENATDALSVRIEHLFKARNAALQLVLRERLAERVLELEKDLTLKDHRITALEAQVSEPESPTESDREGTGDFSTADGFVGDEDASGFGTESFEDESSSAASRANVAPVEYEYDIDGDSTGSRKRYGSDAPSTPIRPRLSIGGLPRLANEIDRVIRDANDDFASEVYQALADSNAELHSIVQQLVGREVEELESSVDANTRKMERIRAAVAGLHLLVTSSSDDESDSKARRPGRLFEPYAVATGSDSIALGSATAKGGAFLETVTAKVEEASAPDARHDLPAWREDTIGDEVDEPAYDNAVTPPGEQSSIPIEDPDPDRFEVIPARVETIPKDPDPSDEDTTADEDTNDEAEPVDIEGSFDAEEAILPYGPLLPTFNGLEFKAACPDSRGVP